MSNEEKRQKTLKNGIYLMELIRAALLETKAPEKPEDLDWQELFDLAHTHKVGGLTAFALPRLENKPSEELYKKWSSLPQLFTRRVLMFDIEREQILEEMRKTGLSFLPLKGVHIIHYYPKAGMRTMADNDILFGFVERDENGVFHIKGNTPEEQKQSVARADEKMNEIMFARGYRYQPAGEVHLEYLKKPIYNYEMHNYLVPEASVHSDYYANPWVKAVQDAQDVYSFHFPDEDEYLFFMAHAYKHFVGSGFGMRFLADTYVFLKKKPNMNRPYLEQELAKMGMSEFEHAITALVSKIFTPGELTYTEEELKLLLYMTENGAYGRLSTRVLNKISNIAGEDQTVGLGARVKYVWSRIYPDEKFWKKYHPIAYKYPVLRPLVSVKRFVKGIFVHPKRLFVEWMSVWKKQK